MFNDLDKFLKTRKVPDMPEGLSARIIAAAHRADGVAVPSAHNGLKDFVTGLWADILNVVNVPQPAYALAALAVFVVGMGLGMNADDLSLLSGLSVGDLAGFMEIQDSFVVAEWV